jgi:hypothetical protein
MPPKGLVPSRLARTPLPGPDPVTLAGAAGATLFAAGMGGLLAGGFTACLGGMLCYMHWQQQRQLVHNRMQQENLAHFMHGAGTPEEVARLRGELELPGDDLYGFLQGIKDQYGGESVRGTGRLAGDEQLEAVSPGVSLTLAHDLGFWYAKLVFSGDTGRKFLHGEYTQWRARGRTPQEAIENVIKRCGLSRKEKLIQEYAAKMVREGE